MKKKKLIENWLKIDSYLKNSAAPLSVPIMTCLFGLIPTSANLNNNGEFRLKSLANIKLYHIRWEGKE